MSKIFWQTCSELQDNFSNIETKWLFDEGSLTKRLTILSQNNFSLEVLSEKQKRLRVDECKYLNISFPQKEWVREVILKGYNQPWVYARSVIIPHYRGIDDQNSLVNIGHQPLGFVLFGGDGFKRSSLEVSTYPSDYLPKQYSYQGLWARRSLFQNNTQAALVQEVFFRQFWFQVK